jgi:hypothetical protein
MFVIQWINYWIGRTSLTWDHRTANAIILQGKSYGFAYLGEQYLSYKIQENLRNMSTFLRQTNEHLAK